MRRVTRMTILAAALGGSGPAWTAEQTVRLQVDNISCISCRYIIEQTLAAVPGVSQVRVFAAEGEALVTYDDARTDVAVLTAATADVGFPSRPLAEAK